MEIRYAGGPTALIELGGLRLLTDPTFDAPGDYPIGNRALTKTAGPGFGLDEAGAVDVVLLSHDQHPDNLDRAGREFLASVPLVLSTASAAGRVGGPVRALPNWSEVEVGGVRVTGVPAQHGPDGTEHLTGEVTGFVLSGDGLPTVYVSGDNASLDVVREVAGRFPEIDVALLFAGAARTPIVAGFLTLTSEDAATAADILGARHVVPLHFEQWGHFTQGRQSLEKAFAGFGDRVRLLAPGERVELS
jgi:L-ascorbate metabolism protein UlaG (beta-lactamase superfamily)